MNKTMQCPHCGKGNLIKGGHALKPGVGQVQQYRCKDCGRSTTKPLVQYRNDRGQFIPSEPTPTTVITSSDPLNLS